LICFFRTFRHQLGNVILLLAPAAFAATSEGHSYTEPYIPIGQSPGMSGQYTHTGRITNVDKDTYTVTIRTEAGDRYEVRVLPDSAIWVDRSKARRPPRDGDFSDCRKGRRVEVKAIDTAGETAAVDWMKIEAN
jgi:hypothetical protein